MPQWSKDGQNIYFILENDMKSQLIKYSLMNNTSEEVTPENIYLDGYSRNYYVTDNQIIFESSTSNTPSEIYLLKEGQIDAITSENEDFIKNRLVGSTELISFQSFDDLVINGMMIKPHDFDPKKKYPLMVRIHGGPVSQYGRYFDFDWQLFASNDYVVIVTNPRGSSGRGFEFQKSIFANWGIEDSKDISAALDFALDLGYIDENKLGIGGWSYGSMLTNYVIAKDDRFHAATSGAGISNILSGFGDDHYIREYIIEMGTPWDNLDAWLNVSHPFLNADDIVTPTLFLVGEKDYNVPLIGSEQMYQALKHLNIPTQLIIYPDQNHGLSKPSYIQDRLDRYLDWYEKYLGEQSVN
jgi:dipeptidyl aminopeptidase/acylaminoacyl peptidase